MTAVEADAAEFPATPGAWLRRERESRGLTEQQAAEQLNLDVAVVTALETDDFGALGAPVFAKGHLRRYAGMLGLPVDELLDGYEHSRARPDQPSLIPKARVEMREMMPVRGRPKWPWVLGGAVAFLAAAGLVAYLSAYGLHLPGAAAKGDAAVAPATVASTAARSAPPPVGGAAAGDARNPAVAASAPVVAAGQVGVVLRFAADSWIEVYDGTGKAVLYDLGKAGTERAFAASPPLSVTVGNPGAVSVTVNGRVLATPPMPPGQTVARFTVAADGSLH